MKVRVEGTLRDTDFPSLVREEATDHGLGLGKVCPSSRCHEILPLGPIPLGSSPFRPVLVTQQIQFSFDMRNSVDCEMWIQDVEHCECGNGHLTERSGRRCASVRTDLRKFHRACSH